MEIQVGRSYKDGYGRVYKIDNIIVGGGTYPVQATFVSGPPHLSDKVGDTQTFMVDGKFMEREAGKSDSSDLKEDVTPPEAEVPQFNGMNDPKRFEGVAAELLHEVVYPNGPDGPAEVKKTDGTEISTVDSGASATKLRLQALIYALLETVPLGKLQEAVEFSADNSQAKDEFPCRAAAAAALVLAGEVLGEK